MANLKRIGGAILLIAFATAPLAAAPTPTKVIKRIDLSKPFHLLPGASFVATQGRPVVDPIPIFKGETAPAAIHMCLRVSRTGGCNPALDNMLDRESSKDWFSDIHYLEVARLEFPDGRAGPPLLHLQGSSLHSGDGDQRRAIEMLANRPGKGGFESIYHEQIGNNHNEEVRYIPTGPLRGSVIAALSPYGPPFSYVIKVSHLTSDYRYKLVLHYRSATLYGDGNPLAVIDSEMPNILRKLGLWHRGDPIPLPPSPCPNPHLVKSELWCK